MDIEKQVQKVADLISRLREVDTDFRVSGAKSHRYRQGPPLSEEELSAFETKHNIELPPDYRLYLKTVADGNGDSSPWTHESVFQKAGAGPHYGLFRLKDTVGGHVSEAFPFNRETDVELELLNLWDYRAPGLLHISTQGCTDNTHLVVQGAAYGAIWESVEYSTFWPTYTSFTEWLCNWVNRCIPLVIQERVVNSIIVGMTTQEVIEVCGDDGQRPYSFKRLGSSMRHLCFEGLHTSFEIGENDKVTGIYNYPI